MDISRIIHILDEWKLKPYIIKKKKINYDVLLTNKNKSKIISASIWVVYLSNLNKLSYRI